MKKPQKKLPIIKYIACAAWILTLGGLFVYYVAFAPRDESYSATENRMLSPMPTVSAENIFGSHNGQNWQSGNFSADFEAYLVDAFPLRTHAISFSQAVRTRASVATYDDFVRFSQGQQDPLQGGAELLPAPSLPQPDNLPQNDIATQQTPSSQDGGEAPLAIPQKPEPNLADWPASMGVHMQIDGQISTQRAYSQNSVHIVAQYLNEFASLLPQDGQLAFIMVPQSVVANRFLAAEEDDNMYSDFEDFIYAFTADNVQAISATKILGEAMKQGEYVYFRSDMHWNTYGTYLVYAQAVQALGRAPTPWSAYTITAEEPFLGTYHRDNPSSYFTSNPDRLDLYELPGNVTMQRASGGGTFVQLPLLDMNAAQNDRYTVFMGGPSNYTILSAEEQNGQEGNCLVITDSFGLSFVPLLTGQYEEVHYVDPRYYDITNGSLTQLAEQHGFTDCYVVLGDLHSFDNNFLNLAYNLME